VLDKMQQELEDYRLAVRVSREEFDEWKRNKITKRFFVDIEEEYLSLLIYIASKKREDYPEKLGNLNAIEKVLNYKPSEIADDNNEEDPS